MTVMENDGGCDGDVILMVMVLVMVRVMVRVMIIMMVITTMMMMMATDFPPVNEKQHEAGQ